MTETADWKQKYRDSIQEMEHEERRWREVERLLRKLIGRLCAAGMGSNPQLDQELVALAAANRRDAEAAELERLAESLTTAVFAMDRICAPAQASAPADAPAAARWDATRAAVCALLEQLASGTGSAAASALLIELGSAHDDAGLAAVLGRAADLIRERGDELSRERLHAAAVLSEVTKRLEEMAGYLTDSDNASRTRFDDTQSLNDSLLLQVREMTVELSGATELGLLQSAVSARLETVARQVCEFRTREASRMLEYNGRTEHMRSRIADLEREAGELHSKLAAERSGARLDPLTGIANRKSFDERFALEIGRQAAGAPAAVMLLWDIDNFKVINDRYGHRAGDRVLKSVAGCFGTKLRAADFVARIGGEEFAVLISGMNLDQALKIANQVRAAVEALRFHFRGTPVHVTASCGVTEMRAGDRSEAVFDRADAALYRAKNAGKNLCVAA